MEKKENNIRITMRTFDLAKGTLMLVVILVHMFPYYDLSRYPVLTPFLSLAQIAAYGAMAVFYIMSGYGFKERSVKATLKKTFQELIKPYIVVMMCVAVLFPIIHYANFRWWPSTLEETIRLVLAFLVGVPESGKMLFGYELYSCSVVWFLLALFIAHNLVNLILKIKNEMMQIFVVILVFILGYVLFRIDFSYFCIPRGLLMVEGVYLGYIFKKYKVIHRIYNRKITYVLLLAVVFGTVCFDLNPQSDSFLVGVITYLCGDCIGILLLLLSVLANRYENKFLDLLREIGIYTYWIMCIHCIEIVVIPWYRWGAVMSAYPVLAFLIDGCVKTVLIISGCKLLKTVSRYTYKRKQKRYAQ